MRQLEPARTERQKSTESEEELAKENEEELKPADEKQPERETGAGQG